MTAPVTQTISNTRLSGSQSFTFTNTAAPMTECDISIDRTVNGGLNSLPTPTPDALIVNVDYSTDNGATWINVAGASWTGGTFVTKGVTLATESIGIGIGQPFPVGTMFRFDTTAAQPVRIAGTVVYSYDY